MPTFTGGGNRPSRKMRRGTNRGGSNSCSLSVVIVYGMLLMMFLYVTTMVVLTRYAGFTWTTTPSKSNDGDYKAHVYTRDEWGDRQKPAFDKKKDWGNGVKPELLRGASAAGEKQPKYDPPPDGHQQLPPKAPQATNRVLTAYLEPIDQSAWDQKPLPTRTWTSEDLTEIKFPKLQSCSRLTEQFPVDEFPEEDPFLPWIHDVFPTHDGKFIQFIAQNKRRCKSGSNAEEKEILKHMQPQVALFQHVAVKRIKNATESEPPRYRLARHEDADEDGMVTRFICRFHPSGQETLSVYNFNYEWASYRKKAKKMFHEDSGDNKSIHTSQLIFQCPVPDDLVDIVKSGESVLDDQATLFVDVIPIRTPPRYGSPNGFLPPYYQTKQFQAGDDTFDPKKEWGSNHILPAVQDSGRWENIPICKPTLQTYYHGNEHTLAKDDKALEQEDQQDKPPKKHRLVSCLWASSGYATRGNRFAINDGQRRLLEWITYNKLIGVEHFYLYENSGAFSDSDDYEGLQPIANLFPDDVTVIKWPSKVCNNNPNNVDSVGERSSQYAAEASCRLRFGPHTDWIAQFDIDEYLVPMGNHTSIHTVLDKLDQEGNKILSFGSWRAWPRRRFIEEPVKLNGPKDCGRNQDCFQLRIPMNYTMLQAYNCDRQKPGQKKSKMPAEKQIYRPDYVLHHFIHYSTVTQMSDWNKDDVEKHGYPYRVSAFPDQLSRFGDENNEALMLHTKAVATQDTVFWEEACKATYDGKKSCRLGSPFPEDMTGVNETRGTPGDEGWKFNCYVNHKIDDYWVKRLENELKNHIPEIAKRGPITWN